jgi:HD-GYP domain-containing protein (c-di-GMP phosphodiesterase class II)
MSTLPPREKDNCAKGCFISELRISLNSSADKYLCGPPHSACENRAYLLSVGTTFFNQPSSTWVMEAWVVKFAILRKVNTNSELLNHRIRIIFVFQDATFGSFLALHPLDKTGTSMRLSEAIGTLAIAGDCATGRPRGSCLTGSVVSTALGQSFGLDQKANKIVYFTSLFRFIGCTATGPEAADLALGDGQSFHLAFLICDWFDMAALEKSLKDSMALHAKDDDRANAIDVALSIHDQIPGAEQVHIKQSEIFAARLPTPSGVVDNISHMFARWDGKIGQFGGNDVLLPARVVSIGHTAELLRRLKGKQAAQDEIAKRAGHQLDPNICEHLLAHWDDIFASLNGGSEFDIFLAAEPGEPVPIGIEHCEVLSLIGADIVDQKTHWMGGHSRRVSALAGRAGQLAGMTGQPLAGLRHAGLLHDIGKCAISNRLLNRQDDLSHTEQLEFETHSHQTEFILSHGNPFRTLGALPSTAQERFNGDGYHRRVAQRGLPENLLAAANLYDELVFDRPSRPAISAQDAAEHLTQESRSGTLMPSAVEAVLQASGSPTKIARKALPFGLTRREAQVIACLARSETTAQIAARLGISEKTADHHIQAIYRKTGVRGRAPIALLAIEHGLGSDEKELPWDTIKRKWLRL